MTINCTIKMILLFKWSVLWLLAQHEITKQVTLDMASSVTETRED